MFKVSSKINIILFKYIKNFVRLFKVIVCGVCNGYTKFIGKMETIENDFKPRSKILIIYFLCILNQRQKKITKKTALTGIGDQDPY